jgi:hypothetical protein
VAWDDPPRGYSASLYYIFAEESGTMTVAYDSVKGGKASKTITLK